MGFCLVFTVTSVFWGPSATSKRVNDVGVLSGVCWPKLPGLVGAIVLTLRDPAVAMKRFQPPCSVQEVKE